MLCKRIHSTMLGTLITAASVLFAAASPAAAGTYSIQSCTNHPNGSLAGWAAEATAGTSNGLPYWYTANNCQSGGYGLYRSFEDTTIPGGAFMAWSFNAPANTSIDSAYFGQQINPRAAGAYDSVFAVLADGSRRAVATYIGNTGTNVGDTTYSMPTGTDVRQVRTELGCQSTVSSCTSPWNGANGNTWQIRAMTIKVRDSVLPTFTSVSGPGWTATPADGVSTINYDVADKGGGLANVRFLVDGIEHLRNGVTCVAGNYVPCPLTAKGSFALDTTKLSEGQHAIAILIADYSGNVTTAVSKTLDITVRRPPAASSAQPVTTSNPSWNGGGSPAVGDHLAGSDGSWSGDGITYTYQWQRCDESGLNCTPIDGATELGYTATAADVGHTLVFCVTAANTGGTATSCSAPTPVVVGSHPAPEGSGAGSDRPTDATPATPAGATGTPVPQPSGGAAGAGAVDRGAPNGSPAAERVVLTTFNNSRASVIKTKYGKRVKIGGRLVAPTGTPIAGALLSVQTQTAVPGASMADAAQVRTDADGRFTYLAPVGPSRTIRFGYRTYTADTAFADTTDVRLLVAAGVTLKATPKKVRNRHATIFKGRLLGKPISKRGVIVDLQVFFRHQWRTFAAPRSNRAGAFKFKYRFMAGAATWRFRARVRKESSYPYELGYSRKPVKVKVSR